MNSDSPDLRRVRIVGGREFVLRPLTDEDVFQARGVIDANVNSGTILPDGGGALQRAIVLVLMSVVEPPCEAHVPANGQRKGGVVYLQDLGWDALGALISEVLGEALDRRIAKGWNREREAEN